MKFSRRLLLGSCLAISVLGLPLSAVAQAPSSAPTPAAAASVSDASSPLDSDSTLLNTLVPDDSGSAAGTAKKISARDIAEFLKQVALARTFLEMVDPDITAEEVERRRTLLLPQAEAGLAEAQLELGKLYIFEDIQMWNLQCRQPEIMELQRQMDEAETIDDKLFQKWQQKLTPAEEEEAQQAHAKWEAARNALAEQETKYHDYYLQQGEHWLKQAIEQHNTEASLILAKIYLYRALRLDIERNREHSPFSAASRTQAGIDSFNLLLPVAQAGHPIAQYYLGRLYDKGVGTKRDPEKAAAWMEKAAKGGCLEAKYEMVRWYAIGHGCEKNQDRALEMYKDIVACQQRIMLFRQKLQELQAEESQVSGTQTADSQTDAVPGGYSDNMRLFNIICSAMGNVYRLEIARAFAYKDTNALLQASEQQGSGNSLVRYDPELSWEMVNFAADNGDPRAARVLGERYFSGYQLPEGQEAQPKKAVEYLQKAAEGGDCVGGIFLAALYYNGTVVPQNKKKAIDLARQALSQRTENYDRFFNERRSRELYQQLLQACEMLPQVADSAEGWLLRVVSKWLADQKQYKVARQLALVASDKDDCEAQLLAAHLFCRGLGGSKNLEQAIQQLERAAKQGDRIAQFGLGCVYYDSDSPEVRRDLSRSYSMFKQSSQSGDPVSTLCLGYLTRHGLGTATDAEAGQKLYFQACEQGVIEDLSQGTATSDRSSCPNFECLDDALGDLVAYIDSEASLGHGQGLLWKGELCKFGLGHDKDDKKARELFDRAAATGEREPVYQVALMHFNWDGNGFANGDPAKGWELLQKAAKLEQPHALGLVGRALCAGCLEGLPVTQDMEKGLAMLKRAAEMGNEEAADELQIISELKSSNGDGTTFQNERTSAPQASAPQASAPLG